MNKMTDNKAKPVVKSDITLAVDDFGFIDGINKPGNLVKRFTWKTENGMMVQVITYGGIITTVKVPDGEGKLVDLVMGFDDMAGYQQSANPYFGATVGRVANRTADGRFCLDGVVYELNKNATNSHLHGGIKGFDKMNWDYYVDGKKVVLSYLSPDGEEKYPGSVLTQVTYEIVDNMKKNSTQECPSTPILSTIKIHMKSISTKPTPVNLCNHSYFNLAGHGSGAVELYQHSITINSDKYTPLNENLVTTGKKHMVVGTNYDLRAPTLLDDVIAKDATGGFDINYCLNDVDPDKLNFVSSVTHTKSKRVMEVYSNQPGVQFYTANFLPKVGTLDDKGNPVLPLLGKNGAAYARQGSFCLETQNYPNAINYPEFPNSVLYPGKEYIHKVDYSFGW